MTIKIKLKDGTEVTCDTPEEAARLVKKMKEPVCGQDGCEEPKDGAHCGACGTHHYGMC